jgi:hypothetical protein
MPYIGMTLIKPMIDKHPRKEAFTTLFQQTAAKSFFIEMEKEEAYIFGCLMFAILAQHGVGGLLCIPSVFNLAPYLGVSAGVASTLACHGALCEAGWELQDTITRLYERAKYGEKKQPLVLLIIIGMHHFMGMSMVIPMNLFYGSNQYYHELVFLLQFAAFVAMGLQNLGYFLDLNTPEGLRTSRYFATFVFITMLYSRLFRFWFVGYMIVTSIYADGATGMLILGCFVLTTMGLFNLLMVADAGKKFFKLATMELNNEALKKPQTLQLAKTASMDALSMGLASPAPFVELTGGQKRWAKLRGAVKVQSVLKKTSDAKKRSD